MGDARAMTPATAALPRTRRAYDHRLREQVVRCGAKVVARHLQRTLAEAGASARRCCSFLDEMFSGAGAKVPEDLAMAKSNARTARLAANRAMFCERCFGQQTHPPQTTFPL